MTRLNYHKTNQKRQMWRHGTEQIDLPPVPGSKTQVKKRRKNRSQKESAPVTDAQTTANQQLASPSSHLTRAQKVRAARRHAKKLKDLQRKQERHILGDTSYEKTVTASRLSSKQFLTRQKRSRARLIVSARAKQDSRDKEPVHAPSSIKLESDQ